MSRLSICVFILLLAACAAQGEAESSGVEQAIRDYIEVREPPEQNSMRTDGRDHWEELDPKFVIYYGTRTAYLVEFSRDCRALQEYPVVADVRRDPNRVHARSDTIRGCHIYKIFELTEDDVAELTAFGVPVDGGN